MLHQNFGPMDTNTTSAVESKAGMSKPCTGETVFDRGDGEMVEGEHPTYPSVIPSTSLPKMIQGDSFMRDSNCFSSSRQNSEMYLGGSGYGNLEKPEYLTNTRTYSIPLMTKPSKDVSYACKVEGAKSEDNNAPFPSTSNDVEDNENRQSFSAFTIFTYSDCLDIVLLIFGIFFAVASGLGMPIFSFLYGKIIQKLIDAKNGSNTHAPVYYMLYLGLGLTVVSTGRVFCWTLSASRQVTRIQRYFFRACLRQEIGWHDLHSPGELTSRISGDTRIIHNGINEKLAQGITNFSTGVFGLILGLILCWELTLVMASVLPVLLIITIFVGKRIREIAEASRREYAVAGSIATEVMSNIKIVQAFGKEQSEIERFHEAALNAQALGVKMSFISSITPGIFMSISLILYCVGFIFASYLVQWGRAGVDEIISTFITLLISIFSFSSIASSMMAFIEARAAAYEIFKVIKSSPVIDVDADGEPVSSFNESIELRHVKFSYPARPDMILFRDLNLIIRKGQKVAFSGVSGCGKSSIIGLIQRFYDPNGGQLLCDGVDMRRLSLKDWRNQIGVVSQEPSLFAGSMTYNVRLGKPTATFEEVVEACKKANIHNTIMSLPAQYDTSVGAVGSQLSGGQKQRIAIARALIKKPSILLLDEATSALDLKSEIEVQEALDSLIKDSGMTVIIISHRLSTIRDVDCIYYIRHNDAEGSIITESGAFDELIAQNGEFAAMARIQGAFSKSQVETTAGAQDAVKVGYSNVVLDDKALSKLEEEVTLTERQKVPIEKLASWEAKHTKVESSRIMSYCKDYTWAVAVGILGSAISGSVFPVNTLVYGYILDVLSAYTYDKDDHKLRKHANLYAPLFLMFAVASFLGVLFQTFYGYVGQRLTTRIRTLLFSRILQQDMSFFDIPGRDAGSLSAMLSGDCEAVHQLWGPSIGFKIQTFSGFIAGTIIGFVFEWRLALVVLACMPLIAGSIYFQDTLYLRFIDKDDNNNESIVTESLSNIRTVASFKLKDELTAAFHELQVKESSKAMKRSIIVAICYGIARFIFYGIVALCYWYGGELIRQGKTEFRNVVICISSLMTVSMEVGDAGGFATKVADAHKAAKNIFSVIDRTPDIDRSRKGDIDIGVGCQISFGEVLFIYPVRPKQVVLDSINLQFNNATFSGLIGETGCGKSTIIQILARFYDKRSGRITVNGKNLEDIDITEWRKNLSIILQEPNLFSGTVRENIRYSKDDATDEEIEAASKLADIHHDILNWPEGYNTQVGYMGRGLSGGQKQRVAIARALLRKPKLLLLDEATSALDNVTEARVQQGINSFQDKTGATTISIAHRLSTVRNCDRIILMHSGHVIEQGSHDELIRLGDKYKAQWEAYNKSFQ